MEDNSGSSGQIKGDELEGRSSRKLSILCDNRYLKYVSFIVIFNYLRNSFPGSHTICNYT